MAKSIPELLASILSKSQKSKDWWARLTPEERSIEMKRRVSVSKRSALRDNWEKIHNGDPEALAKYEETKQKIRQAKLAWWNSEAGQAERERRRKK